VPGSGDRSSVRCTGRGRLGERRPRAAHTDRARAAMGRARTVHVGRADAERDSVRATHGLPVEVFAWNLALGYGGPDSIV
jgi:hypothetical protein